MTELQKEQMIISYCENGMKRLKELCNPLIYRKGIHQTDVDYDDLCSLAMEVLLESAKVFQTRRKQKMERYQELLEKKHQGELGADEEEFLELYKVLSSYGMVEKLPKNMLDSKFEERLQRILELGNAIIAEHKME